MGNRTQNAIKNAGFGILTKIINLIFAFVARTIFINVLGTTYLGVNGLFTEVLSLLSFAELGFGSAMTFTMYKPVVDNDKEKIKRLMDFYKYIYRIIALIITILGLICVPFLQYIVKDAEWLSRTQLDIYFLIFLINTVIGYFVSYKFTYLNALQKNYIQTNIDSIVTISSNIIQIIVILISENFLFYLCANSFVLLISRVFINAFLNYKYPILKEKPSKPLSKSEKEPIYNEVRGLAVHQFASAAVHSTDNLLISSLISVKIVGLISNYTMLMNAILNFVTILFNSVTSGFGNMVASSSISNFKKVFKDINFANFWIYGFCSIAFWILIPPFITLWIGNDKLIDFKAFTLIILNCYFQGQCTAYNNARIAKGNFNKDKWWAIVQALVNLFVSIACTMKYGLVGIYIGTITSRMVYVLFRPYSTYEFLFEESCVHYYKKLFWYFFQVTFTGIVTKKISNLILKSISIKSFIVVCFIVLVIPNVIFLVFNFKSEEFNSWKNRLVQIMRIN